MHLPKYITTRSTPFGFAIVLILCAALVWVLFIQIDIWSRAGFDLIKNNNQQARLVSIMRNAVQKRETLIQRMMNKRERLEIGDEMVKFYHLAGVYAQARDELLNSTRLDKPMMASLQQLDDAVSYAQPYQNNLVEAIMYEDIRKEEMEAIIEEGNKASEKVLFLLDKMVERQSYSYEKVVADYEYSRQFTLYGAIGVFVLITLIIVVVIRTSSKQFNHVTRLSVIDEVSGIYNRRYFDMVLEEEWNRSMREYTQISLLMLDIDYFKAYNDAYGHQMGDGCLYTVGKILSGQLKRASDFAARYGGEEFVVVLPDTRLQHARLLAESLRQSVEEAKIKSGNDTVSEWVTVSIGVATTTAEYGQDYSRLVNAADNCLYESKHSGRNRVSDCLLESQD